MAEPTKKELAEALAQFANFKSEGVRGIARMLRMQEDARKMLMAISIAVVSCLVLTTANRKVCHEPGRHAKERDCCHSEKD